MSGLSSPSNGPESSNLSNTTRIRILADHREAASAAVAALRAKNDVSLDFDHLPTGDYLVEDRFLFERKTLVDFAESIKDGRLFRQGLRLAAPDQPSRGVLILEGTSVELAQSRMRRESMQGALVMLSLFFGIPILRSASGEESARLMRYAARQSRAFASGALPRHGRRPKGKRKTQLAILQSLPGVGARRAEQLLDAFGSVEAALGADADALERVPGLGQRTARAIRWAVEEAEAAYGHESRKTKEESSR